MKLRIRSRYNLPCVITTESASPKALSCPPDTHHDGIVGVECGNMVTWSINLRRVWRLRGSMRYVWVDRKKTIPQFSDHAAVTHWVFSSFNFNRSVANPRKAVKLLL